MPEEKTTKKQRILGIAARMQLKQAGVREFRALQNSLIQQYGPERRPSLGYIARVLEKAGIDVQSSLTYTAPLPEPYATRLKGILHFSTLAATEDSIAALDRLYQEFRQAGDREGPKWVRTLALQGKWRARAQAAIQKWRPKNESRSARFQIGFTCGSKLPRCFLTGWRFASRPRSLSGWLAKNKVSKRGGVP